MKIIPVIFAIGCWALFFLRLSEYFVGISSPFIFILPGWIGLIVLPIAGVIWTIEASSKGMFFGEEPK